MKAALLCLFLMLLLACADAFALGVGMGGNTSTLGGGGGGRGHGGGRSTSRGGASVTRTNGAGSSSAPAAPESAAKPAMPAAAAVPEFDATLVSRLDLGLDEKQSKKAEEACAKIDETRKALLKSQTDARANYEKAKTAAEVQAAGRSVMTAKNAIQQFNPKQELERAMRLILSGEQLKKLREAAK